MDHVSAGITQDNLLPEYEPATVASTDASQELVNALKNRIEFYWREAGVPDELIQKAPGVIAELLEQSLSKFADGQRHYGGDIRDRDLEREMVQEGVDMFMYYVAKRCSGLKIMVGI